MQWEPDRGLQLRMGVAVLVIVVLPVAFALAMLWIANVVVPALTAAFLGVELGGGWRVSLRVLVVLALGGVAAQYLLGDRVVLRSVGARRVGPEKRPDLHAKVSRLAQQVGLAKPAVAVVDSPVPNAFATGRTPESSTVVVTEGLVDELADDEVDAVLAHEIAHVRNRDVAVMTVAYLLPTLTYVVAIAAYTLLSGIWGIAEHLRHMDGDDARPLVAVIAILVVTAVLTLAVSTFFWLGSFLVYRLLSRYREHAADRGAAQITGDPLALASALETIDGQMETLPDRDLRKLDGGIEALYVSPLDAPMFTDQESALVSRDVFPESHPPTDERIDRLAELAGELERI